MYSFLRQTTVALRALLVLTLVLGVLYPALLLGIGRAVPARADGSPLTVDGRVAGSRLLAQESTGRAWFHPRPSAPGLDGSASGGSNLGPNEPDQVAAIAERRTTVARTEGIDPADVPADALTASSSGLDPHISPEYAEIQVDRVARARGLQADRVRDLVEQATEQPPLGFLGQPTVNVAVLNASLPEAERS